MSNPANQPPPEPTSEEELLESTVCMPGLKIIPDLTVPPATVVMPAYKAPKTPHLGDDDTDKK